MRDLDAVIGRWREDAAAARRIGEPDKAALLDRCATEAEAGAGEWLHWITEPEAALRSGRSAAWLRGRFREWQPQGHARQVGRAKRVYRAAVVPRRPSLVEAANAGRAAARALRTA